MRERRSWQKPIKETIFLLTHSDTSSYSTKAINSDQDSDAMHIKKAPVMAVTPTGEEIDIFEIYQGALILPGRRRIPVIGCRCIDEH